MKLIKKANGKTTLSINKTEWIQIGKNASWDWPDKAREETDQMLADRLLRNFSEITQAFKGNEQVFLQLVTLLKKMEPIIGKVNLMEACNRILIGVLQSQGVPERMQYPYPPQKPLTDEQKAKRDKLMDKKFRKPFG